MIAKGNRHVSNIHDYQSRRYAYETSRILFGQASGTRKCLEMIRDSGTDILRQ